MQFGAGAQLAAQCTRLPAPDGWRPWTDQDGPIPDALAQRALAIAADQTVSLGATESYPLPGVTVLLRVEPHTWNRDNTGNLIEGCFRAGAPYLPEGTPSVAETVNAPAEDGWGKTVTVLTAVSLVIGIGATLAAWGSK